MDKEFKKDTKKIRNRKKISKKNTKRHKSEITERKGIFSRLPEVPTFNYQEPTINRKFLCEITNKKLIDRSSKVDTAIIVALEAYKRMLNNNINEINNQFLLQAVEVNEPINYFYRILELVFIDLNVIQHNYSLFHYANKFNKIIFFLNIKNDIQYPYNLFLSSILEQIKDPMLQLNVANNLLYNNQDIVKHILNNNAPFNLTPRKKINRITPFPGELYNKKILNTLKENIIGINNNEKHNVDKIIEYLLNNSILGNQFIQEEITSDNNLNNLFEKLQKITSLNEANIMYKNLGNSINILLKHNLYNLEYAFLERGFIQKNIVTQTKKKLPKKIDHEKNKELIYLYQVILRKNFVTKNGLPLDKGYLVSVNAKIISSLINGLRIKYSAIDILKFIEQHIFEAIKNNLEKKYLQLLSIYYAIQTLILSNLHNNLEDFKLFKQQLNCFFDNINFMPEIITLLKNLSILLSYKIQIPLSLSYDEKYKSIKVLDYFGIYEYNPNYPRHEILKKYEDLYAVSSFFLKSINPYSDYLLSKNQELVINKDNSQIKDMILEYTNMLLINIKYNLISLHNDERAQYLYITNFIETIKLSIKNKDFFTANLLYVAITHQDIERLYKDKFTINENLKLDFNLEEFDNIENIFLYQQNMDRFSNMYLSKIINLDMLHIMFNKICSNVAYFDQLISAGTLIDVILISQLLIENGNYCVAPDFLQNLKKEVQFNNKLQPLNNELLYSYSSQVKPYKNIDEPDPKKPTLKQNLQRFRSSKRIHSKRCHTS